MNQCFDHSCRDIRETEKLQAHNEERQESVCIVRNVSGIHVRPAGSLVKLIENEQCEVTFTYEGRTINAKSIMGILMLGVPQGGEVLVHVQGKEACQVMCKIKEAFASGFGEL